MTTQTLADTKAQQRGRLASRVGRHLVVPLVIAVAMLVSDGIAQVVTPFIRSDDWPFLLPAQSPGVGSVLSHGFTEGRWLNTAWWAAVGQHGTPTSASVTYALGYGLFVAGTWRVLHAAGLRPRLVVDILIGVALFVSAVWVELLYWPGTLTPSVLVAAAAVWTLPWVAARQHLGWLLGWLVVVEAASVLTYPPVGALMVLLAVTALKGDSWRKVMVVVGAWVTAFALGVVIACTLNYLWFGDFGLQLASWRRPHYGTSLQAMSTNFGRWASGAAQLWSGQWWAGFVAVFGALLGWHDVRIRPRLQRLLVGVAVVLALDLAQTLVTGIVTPSRGQLWSWVGALLAVVLLLLGRQRLPLPWSASGLPVEPVVGLALATLAFGGTLAWRSDVVEHQATRTEYASIAARATGHDPAAVSPTVVIFQPATNRKLAAGSITAITLRMAIREAQDGVLPRYCRGVECRLIAERLGEGSVIRLGAVGAEANVVGVVVPPPPGWL
ncbi:hypothetical protein ACXR8F_04890 [Terrabacter sp. AAH1]